MTTEEQIYKIVADHFGKDPSIISDDTNVLADLKSDSLDLIEISMKLEEVFDIAIPDHIVESWDNVGDAKKSIYELLDRPQG